MLEDEVADERISERRKATLTKAVTSVCAGHLTKMISKDLDITLESTTIENIAPDKDLTAIVQVSRIGSKLTMDMTCFVVEKQPEN